MNPFCVGVDWGTSSFRLWVMASDGTTLSERRSDEGLIHSGKVGFENVLETHLSALGVASDLPVIICGMAGSASGWREAGYVDTPADLGEIVRCAVSVGGKRDVRILGGIAQRDADFPDVMRGEETQLLGLVSGLVGGGVETGLVCLPGTHSKWVDFGNNRVRQFATFMSGEIFAILAQHSILSLTMATADADDQQVAADDPVFLSAVEQAIETPAQVSNQLFAARASALLGFGAASQNTAKLSGALIGLEIAGAQSRFGAFDNVHLVGSGNLGALYAHALASRDIAIHQHDAELMVRAGLLAAARGLWQ